MNKAVIFLDNGMKIIKEVHAGERERSNTLQSLMTIGVPMEDLDDRMTFYPAHRITHIEYTDYTR